MSKSKSKKDRILEQLAFDHTQLMLVGQQWIFSALETIRDPYSPYWDLVVEDFEYLKEVLNHHDLDAALRVYVYLIDLYSSTQRGL